MLMPYQKADGQIVSIADATLASSQPVRRLSRIVRLRGFNRRRDACFLATPCNRNTGLCLVLFQSQTRRLLPRNSIW